MTTSNPGAGGGELLGGTEFGALGQTLLDEILDPVSLIHGYPPMGLSAAPAQAPPPSLPGAGLAVPHTFAPPPELWTMAGADDPYMVLDGISAREATPSSSPLPASVSDGNFYFLDPGPDAAVPEYGSYYDVEAVRRDFPILHKPVNGKPLVWLDNGATTQKPQVVIDAISNFYENDNSNVHRAAHTLAARATEAYENARKIVQGFIGAASPDEIIFVRGTTEAINLAANALGSHVLSNGDEILLTTLEHHANIVPWQMIAARTGAKITPIPIDDSGQVILEEYYRMLSHRTKVVSLAHVSNVLGTVLPLEKMIGPAHDVGAKVLIDGAQSIAHVPVNVRALDADLFAFSGHKIYGPTGIGILYGKLPLLEALPPWQGGGNMIDSVSFEKTTYNKPPAKFEAGTGILAGAVGLGAALSYVRQVGFERVIAHEEELLRQAMELLSAIPGLTLLGTASQKVAVLSFSLAGVDPDVVGRTLTTEGIAIRVGHHCAQPTLRRYGYTSIPRASLGMYNTIGEIKKLADALYRVRR